MKEMPRYFDLTRFALIEITGSEAFAFLHRQITGDLNDINSRGWMFSAWCQANGRVICTFIIFRHNDSLFLLLPAEMKDRILRRLAMYVLRADVHFRDAICDYNLLGMYGINSSNTEHFGTGTRTGNLLVTDTCYVLDQPDPAPRCLVVSKKDGAGVALEKIRLACKKGEVSDWLLLDITAGIPWITESTSEAFLPQMLNLDLMQGLSYRKGCYPGQEVIARLHYRGELKRKLFLGAGKGKTIPAPGSVLVHADTGNKSGDVINVARHPDGGYRLLAVVDNHAASTTMHLQDALQSSVTLEELHYSEQQSS